MRRILGAVCAVVAAAAFFVAVHAHTPARTISQGPFHAEPTAPLPAGKRLASYGEVSLLVPAGLATRTSRCGAPVRQEVVAEDGSGELFCRRKPQSVASSPGTVVWLSTDSQSSPYAKVATAPAVVDGHQVLRGYSSAPDLVGAGEAAGVIAVPAQHVVVGVTAPTRAEVDTILASVRIDAVGRLGCPARRDAVPPAPAGPHDVLVPGTPDLAIRCEYGDTGDVRGALVGSYVLRQAEVTELVKALDELKPDPCACIHGGTSAPGHDDVLSFEYVHGPSVRIDGSIGANLDTYTNRSLTVANYSSTLSRLLARLTNQAFDT